MSTSVTSSEARVRPVESPRGARHLGELVGRTPLLRLQRSGDGHVWIKREGRNPTGSFLDRVARHQLAATVGDVVVHGWTQHAIAVIAQARSLRRVVHHLVRRDDDIRLRALCSAYGVPATRVTTSDEADELAARLQADGAVVLSATDVRAHHAAWMDVAREVSAASKALPATWILSDLGVGEGHVANAIHEAVGREVRLVTVPWDGGEERVLDGPVACRRQQVGHREGLLCSPLGAELIETAVNVALHDQKDVCVVLPEDGHRYLGWW